MPDLLDSRTLQAINEKVVVANSFILDMFFPSMWFFDTKTVDIEQIEQGEGLAAFNNPCVNGNPVGDRGSNIQAYAPAYIKEEKTLAPCNYQNRFPGEPFGTGFSPMRRLQLDVTRTTMELENRIKRRLEWMAVQCLLNGNLVVPASDRYAGINIDFNRAASHDVVLSGTDVWSNAASTPIQDLENLNQLILDDSGVGAGHYVMDPLSYNNFIRHQDVNDQMDFRRGVTQVPNVSPQIAQKMLFKGFLGEWAIWVYNDTYKDALGVTQRYIPDNRVIAVARGMDGFDGGTAYGMIQDVKSMRSQARFAKAIDDERSGSRIITRETAPLPYGKRMNASAVLTTG